MNRENPQAGPAGGPSPQEQARALALRLPEWTVWYGEHTGRFWAVPRHRRLAAAPHVEAESAAELERRAREIQQGFTEALAYETGSWRRRDVPRAE